MTAKKMPVLYVMAINISAKSNVPITNVATHLAYAALSYRCMRP
jgi:hypothetical protein